MFGSIWDTAPPSPRLKIFNFMQLLEILAKSYVGASPTGNPGSAPDYVAMFDFCKNDLNLYFPTSMDLLTVAEFFVYFWTQQETD